MLLVGRVAREGNRGSTITAVRCLRVIFAPRINRSPRRVSYEESIQNHLLVSRQCSASECFTACETLCQGIITQHKTRMISESGLRSVNDMTQSSRFDPGIFIQWFLSLTSTFPN